MCIGDRAWLHGLSFGYGPAADKKDALAKLGQSSVRRKTVTAPPWRTGPARLIRSQRTTIKDAAWSVMEAAYLKASYNDTLPSITEPFKLSQRIHSIATGLLYDAAAE